MPLFFGEVDALALMEFAGRPLLIMPQQQSVNIGFQADMFANISFRLAVVVRQRIDIGMTDRIQQIMSDKSQNIYAGNFAFFFEGEYFGTLQQMAEKNPGVCGMSGGTRIFFGKERR